MKTFTAQMRLVSLVGLLVFLWSTAYAQITPSADSYTNTATPTTNNGAKTLLDVDSASQTTYIQFNLASIPTTASISQATLKLYVNSVTTAGSFNVDYVNSAWSESTIDASNAPTPGTTIASNVNVATADKNQYILINVTPAVQAWLTGSETNNGIALVANGTFNATFDSKENTATSHAPELDIAFAGGEGTITGVTTAGGSGLTGGGTSGKLNLSLTKACASEQVLQWSGSVWACSNAGTGTITGVLPGTALTGGGTGGAVTLNLDTTQVPLLAAPNTFTASQTINLSPSTPSTFAVSASNTNPSATTILGVASASTGDSTGVEGITNSSSSNAYGVYGQANARTGTPIAVYGNAYYGGTGVYGTSLTGNAMVANGNVSQSRTGGGWVKAMVFYDGENGGGLARCYNSTLTGTAATTPPCGFTITGTSNGIEIDFGFEVDDRFLSMNLQRCSCGTEVPIWLATPESTNVISVAVYQAGTATQIPAQWHIIVF